MITVGSTVRARAGPVPARTGGHDCAVGILAPPIIIGIIVLVLQGLLIALTFLFGLALSGVVFLVVVWQLVREGLSLLETLNTARSVDVWWRRWRRRPAPAAAASNN